jgi:hypothetical protein
MTWPGSPWPPPSPGYDHSQTHPSGG